jgi:competence protein ComEC
VSLGAAGLESAGRVVLAVPWLALTWTVAMVRWTASWPGASLEIGQFGAPALALSYAGLLGLRWRGQVQRAAGTLLGWLRSDLLVRVVRPVALVGLALGAALVWAVVLALPDGRLHVWFLDIGQGDGILIQTPQGRQVLVDGGASPERLFNELGAVMPFWDRNLDLLVLTHPDGDHMAAQVEIPSRFRVAAALDTAASQANPDAQPWRDRLAAAGAPVHLQHAGGWVDLGDGAALWIVWPPLGGYSGEDADNENSLVTRLVYGNVSMLLTGDAGKPAEAALLAAGAPVRATVLKVGHHGSTSSSSPAFVAAVNPTWAVIQVGADNDYGHPSPETLEILRGRAVLRNDTQGRIHLATDGGQVWVVPAAGQ